jgi:hypothetical protein
VNNSKIKQAMNNNTKQATNNSNHGKHQTIATKGSKNNQGEQQIIPIKASNK